MATLHAPDLGDISYTDNDLYEFPEGLIGLEELKHFVLIERGEKFGQLFSIEDPSISFIVTEPCTWDLHMAFDLSAEHRKMIGAETAEDLWILYIANLPEGHPEKMTLNLHGPLVINLKNHKAVQQTIQAHQLFGKEDTIMLSTDDSAHLMGHLRD